MKINTWVGSTTKPRMLAGVVAAVVAIAGGWLFFTQTDIGRSLFAATMRSIGVITPQDEPDKSGASQVESNFNHTAYQNIASGKVDTVINDYQDRIKQAANDTERANLLRELSTLLVAADNPSDDQLNRGLEFALQAYQLESSGSSAATVQLAYQALGDKTNAEAYQKIAASKAEAELNEQ